MAWPPVILDHLVVAARTLGEGAIYIRDRLGIEPAGGGSHVRMGTHNRVFNLGGKRYLEVIAIDPRGRKPDQPRWFNLDNPELQAGLRMQPRLIAWVARTEAIDTLSATIYDRPVTVRPMQRGTLQWRFAFTVDGTLPAEGLLPHLIQWQGNRHPTDSMPDSGCCFEGLVGVHRQPETLRQAIARMGLDDIFAVHPAATTQPPGLSARIRTPSGLAVLD